MLSCIDVANYFLTQTDTEDAGDLISNLKLQKLLYYAQGFHLSLYGGEPLFGERIMAWTHGPVVREAYHYYKQYGSGPIPVPDEIDAALYNERTADFLDEIYRIFGQFSAWKLRNMTHEEPPWKDAAPYSGEITHDALIEYFTTQLVDDTHQNQASA